MKPATATTHETHCLAHADHFVAVRGRKPADRIRETFPRIEDAETFASGFGDRRTMIYAVTAGGLSAHIKNA